MAINNLQEKFLHGLGDIYDAEHRFLDAQQEMLEQAQSTTVQGLLKSHITQTEQQIETLEQVYKLLGESPEREKCFAATGIVEEGQHLLEEVSGNPALIDLAIAGSCAKVEHYEIATYRGLITGAQCMGQTDAARLLEKNLNQEEQTAQKIETSMATLFDQAIAQEGGKAARA